MKQLLDAGRVRRVLIIAPLRVARDTWPDEVKKWDHLQDLRMAVAVGPPKQRSAAILSDAQVVTIARDSIDWLVNKSSLPFDFDMIVIDELSSFKSWSSKRSKAIYKVQPRMLRMVGLTGTPSSNGLMDLFAEYKALDGGKRLGRYITHYRETFFRPGWGNGTIVYNYIPLPGAEDRIYKLISDITVSMKAVDHLKMPELVSIRTPVYLEEQDMKTYKQLKSDLFLELAGQEIDAKNAATLSNKLTQMANGAIYGEDGTSYIVVHDKKLDALEDLIESANGNPVLVCYWFKHDHERILQRFPESRDIATSDDIHDWNDRKIPIGLIHPASAGHGLNLQAGGNVMIWFGLTWSLELYQQCCARLWRQGQQEKTVAIYHLVSQGTVDERIMDALERKDATQAALINAVKAELGRI